MCTPLYLLISDGWQNRLVFSLHSSLLQKSFHSGGLQMSLPLLRLKRYFRPPRGGSIRLGHLLPINDPDTPTLLHRSSGSRSPLDISFAPFSLVLSCSCEVLQDLGSDHLPILLSVLLSLRSFAPTSVLLPSTFRKLNGMALPSTLSSTFLLQRNTRFFPLLLLSLLLWH